MLIGSSTQFFQVSYTECICCMSRCSRTEEEWG